MRGFLSDIQMKVDYTKPMDLDFIEEFWEDLDMNQVIQYQKLPQDFIEKHFHKLDSNALVRYQTMTMDFIKEKWQWFNVNVVAQYIIMPIEFIKEKWIDFQSTAIETIAKYQKLTQDFISEKWDQLVAFSDKVAGEISRYQTMAVDFIKEKWEYLDKNYISKYQKLTVDFIKEKWSELSIAAIATFQIIEDDVRELLGLQPPAKTITGAQILAFDPCSDGMDRYHAHTPSDTTVLTWNELLTLHNNTKDGQRDIHWLSWKLGKKINT